ncbi:MAG TPA: hypothetical protein VFZ25_21970, partial [Chloroflexota bacterium]|nr:hypothetical protein [Chloroflexota bacterium]
MPLFGRRAARHAENQPAAPQTPSSAPTPAPPASQTATRYVMKQRLFALGEDFDIRDENHRVVFHVNGKALRARDTLIFEDASGH